MASKASGEMLETAIDGLLSRTRSGPVSGWVDRMGDLVRAFGAFDEAEINWQGEPSSVAFRIACEAETRHKLYELIAFLGNPCCTATPPASATADCSTCLH